jgi:osmotically-inducible protein OsmY
MRSLKSTAGDMELRERVLEELEWDPRIDPSHLHVRVVDGAVSLCGTVTTYSQRLAAVRAAERVQGVKAVADGIDVVLSDDTGRKDSELAAEIAHERTWNTALPATVDVEVSSGHVVLSGYVTHHYERGEAERAVRRLAGIHGVTNSIEVRPRPDSSAAEIESQIEEAIARSAVLDASSITATRTDGVVRLEGTVRSIAERKTAQRVAESAAGVSKVENDIVVE